MEKKEVRMAIDRIREQAPHFDLKIATFARIAFDDKQKRAAVDIFCFGTGSFIGRHGYSRIICTRIFADISGRRRDTLPAVCKLSGSANGSDFVLPFGTQTVEYTDYTANRRRVFLLLERKPGTIKTLRRVDTDSRRDRAAGAGVAGAAAEAPPSHVRRRRRRRLLDFR
ncbi:hypothetical protein EVAR_32500_1 [Eumeta japonica]|uniref:Uncharacterized protein n=1 Tax=Eumeta variegata TaxID=151549 RepID=A0A4C1W7D0_EUMVA|nr:hypothetical protein EVAR_32500_1 [Eumeta japonica]